MAQRLVKISIQTKSFMLVASVHALFLRLERKDQNTLGKAKVAA